MIFSSNSKKMTVQKTINIGNGAFNKLLNLSGAMSHSETVALLILCNPEKDLNNLLKTSKPSRNSKGLRGEGTITFKVTEKVWQNLNKIRQKHSISIVLNCLLKTYDNTKFKKNKTIKELGR